MGLLRRLFASPLPDEIRAELEAEGVLVAEEDCAGSITYRDYRAPGRRFHLKRVSARASIAVTARRVVIVQRRTPLVDLAHDDPRAAELRWSADRPDRVCVAFDVARFHDDRSGTMEIRLTTPRADELLRALPAGG